MNKIINIKMIWMENEQNDSPRSPKIWKLISENKLVLNNLENKQTLKETLLKLMQYALTSQKLNSMTKTSKTTQNDSKEQKAEENYYNKISP